MRVRSIEEGAGAIGPFFLGAAVSKSRGAANLGFSRLLRGTGRRKKPTESRLRAGLPAPQQMQNPGCGKTKWHWAGSLDSVGINRREVVNERVIQEKE